jgi:hypothetical protein
MNQLINVRAKKFNILFQLQKDKLTLMTSQRTGYIIGFS